MAQPDYQDLASLDRDVARASAGLARWWRDLADEPDADADRDPLAPFRHIAGKSAYDAVGGAAGALVGSDAALREGLARWIAHLAMARIGRDLDVALARARAAKEARFPLDPKRAVGYREAWRELVRAEEREAAVAWLAAAEACAPHVAPIARERAAQREEVLRRLDLGGTWELGTPVPRSTLEAGAEEFLARTRDLWRDVSKDALAKLAGQARPSPVDGLRLAVARDAPEGWPARLGNAWLVDLFPGLVRGLKLDVGPLPAAVGASSFARALGAFGFALRASARLPFALARDPSFADAHRFAAAFAGLAGAPEFQRRALGNSARVAAAQARVVRRSLLAEARLGAARVVLAKSDDRLEELTSDLFGAPMPRAFKGAWPALRDDEPARALALLTSLPLARELVQRFDSDWFRNPRAALFLRARAGAPAWDETKELDATPAARTLARAFEEDLA